MTRAELKSFLTLDLLSLTFKNIFWPSYVGRLLPSPPMDSPLVRMNFVRTEISQKHAVFQFPTAGLSNVTKIILIVSFSD